MPAQKPNCASRALTFIKNAFQSLMVILITMQTAYAQAQDPVTKLINKAVDLLTNRWALGSATIAIAILGYKMKYGMVDKKRAILTILGIVVVFGSALIVNEIR